MKNKKTRKNATVSFQALHLYGFLENTWHQSQQYTDDDKSQRTMIMMMMKATCTRRAGALHSMKTRITTIIMRVMFCSWPLCAAPVVLPLPLRRPDPHCGPQNPLRGHLNPHCGPGDGQWASRCRRPAVIAVRLRWTFAQIRGKLKH